VPNYRRPHIPGATLFLTIVTYQRRPLFREEDNVDRLRSALSEVKAEMPFEVSAAVVLPDHMHFLWSLPAGEDGTSARVGKMKLLFTRSLRGVGVTSDDVPASRRRHRESDVWQRRFIDHVIRDADDFKTHLDYIHYNPVKHGLVACPHAWPHSSFRKWVENGTYAPDWCCTCGGQRPPPLDFTDLPGAMGD
jgi:putative transposase